jgi:nucleotide-binding universal stress UspA family protein
MNMDIKNILITIDGTPLSVKAVEWGYALSKKLNANAALVHVVNSNMVVGTNESGVSPQQIMDELRKEGKEIMSRTVQHLGGGSEILEFFAEGKPHEEVIKTAQDWGADIIVMGSHGRTGIKRLLMGSVAENVLRHSKCPVLVIPSITL